MAKKHTSVQIDQAGRKRVEEVAAHFGMTQAGAASLLVRAATDDRVRQLVTELAGRLGDDRSARPESAGG